MCLSCLSSKYSASCLVSHLVLPRWCHTFLKRLVGVGELVFYLCAISNLQVFYWAYALVETLVSSKSIIFELHGSQP